MEQKYIGGHHARFGENLCNRPYKITKFGYCSRRWVQFPFGEKEKPIDHCKEDSVSNYEYYCE